MNLPINILKVPYSDRQLLLVVNNEMERKNKIIELRNKVKLNSRLSDLVVLGIPGFMAIRISPVLLEGLGMGSGMKPISTNRDTSFFIATRKEVSKLQFPTNQIMPDTIYVCNPIDDHIYYDMEQFHKSMVDHKFNEAIHLLQSLGASKIEAYKLDLKKQKGNLSFNILVGGGEGEVNKQKEVKEYFKSTYSPIHTPIIPDELKWYPKEMQWQNIAIGRLENGMRSCEIEVIVTDSFGLNVNVVKKLNNKLKLNVIGDYEKFTKTNIKIHADFEPIE